MQTTAQHVEEVAGMPETPLGRDRDFATLYRDLVEEAGRALEAGEDGWCALLQEVFIPSVEPQGLRALASLGASAPAAPVAQTI